MGRLELAPHLRRARLDPFPQPGEFVAHDNDAPLELGLLARDDAEELVGIALDGEQGVEAVLQVGGEFAGDPRRFPRK